MKLFVCFLILSSTVFARTSVESFNKALIKNVESDIQKDDERFKKPSASRGPASVETREPVFYENQKVDKNVRQLGRSKW